MIARNLITTLRAGLAMSAVLFAGLASGQDGVVRITDRTPAGQPGIHAASFSTPLQSCGTEGCATAGEGCAHIGDGCGAAGNCGCQSGCGTACTCGTNCSCGSMTGACCNPCGSCYVATDCNHLFATCDQNGIPMAYCSDCSCSPCQCGKHRGGRYRRLGGNGDCNRDYCNTLFAQPLDSGTGSACRDCWHGHSMSFRNKNARLADHLFGWLVPSGCCGQGCPPVGKYHMVYADQPDYTDPRDTQLYAAQGYGMPMTVPLAPNVNHAYNYSAGVPASRVTPISNYNPQTSLQSLPCQSW